MTDFRDWQRRFLESPVVYLVVDRDGLTCDVHESREAAQVQVDWASGLTPPFRLRIFPCHVHTMALAKERFGNDD